MKHYEMTANEAADAILKSRTAVDSPVRVMVDGRDVDAKVVRVTGDGLGVVVWAES